MKKFLPACVLVLTALLAAPQAHGWNHKGHMAVAYIAYRQLTTEEEEKLSLLLKSHPDYDELLKAAEGRGWSNIQLGLFIEAARWPDLILNDPRFFDESDVRARPTRNLAGFPDMGRHFAWHFEANGFVDDGRRIGPDAADDGLQMKIGDSLRALADPNVSEAHKAYFMSWLAHLVGDAHQPMHCATRLTPARPRGDVFGQRFNIFIDLRPSEVVVVEANLHTFWDNVLGDGISPLSIVELAEAAEATYPEEDADELDGAKWVEESFEYAKTAAYGPLVRMSGAPVVRQPYVERARELALRRVKLAGYRLARIIKQSLANYTPPEAEPQRGDDAQKGSRAFAQPVKIAPEHAAYVESFAKAIATRKDALLGELARLEPAGFSDRLKGRLLFNLGAARREVVALSERIKQSSDGEYERAADIFFGGLLRRYDRELEAVKNVRRENYKPVRDSAIKLLNDNEYAYVSVLRDAKWTRTLTLISKPEGGASVTYHLDGDKDYLPVKDLTDTKIELGVGLWYFHAELKGYRPRDLSWNATDNPDDVLIFHLEREPPPAGQEMNNGDAASPRQGTTPGRNDEEKRSGRRGRRPRS